MKKFYSLLLVCACALCACTKTASEQSAYDAAMERAAEIGTVQHIAVTSATQIGFLSALNRLDAVCALSTPGLVYNLPTGDYVDIGPDYQISVEQVLLSKPDVLLATQYDMVMPGMKEVEAAGIPVLYISEWRENDPLRRAEWLRVVARLVGEEERADSILNVVKTAYNELVKAGAPSHSENGSKGQLLTGQSYRGTWYVPSSNSYMGRLIKDAGAAYRYQDKTEEGSIPLTMEQVLVEFADADVWIGVSADSMDELMAMDEKHALFAAFRQGRVYNWRGRVNATGGNDFWEMGVVRPDLLIRDLRWALGAEQDPDYQPCFIRRIE